MLQNNIFQFFEGGPKSPLFASNRHGGFSLSEAETCVADGRYCVSSAELDFWYPCDQKTVKSMHNQTIYTNCFFGRGPLQVGFFLQLNFYLNKILFILVELELQLWSAATLFALAKH